MRKAVMTFALLAVSSAAGATMTVTYGGFTLYDHDDAQTKGRATNTVTLDPDPVADPNAFFLRSDPSQAFIDAMTRCKAAAAWTDSLAFTYDGSLNGNLTIAAYAAEFQKWDLGGAQMVCHYTRGEGDPEARDLFWVQVVDTTAPRGGEVGPYVDVYDARNRSLPFSYSPGEELLGEIPGVLERGAPIKDGRYTVNGIEHRYDVAFADWPRRSAPLNGANTWRGELFLAAYNAKAGTVKVYDGIVWGFDVSNVTVNAPAPGALALLGLGGAAGMGRRRSAGVRRNER